LYLIGSHRRLGGFIGFDAHLPWEIQMDIALRIGAASRSGGDGTVSRGVECARGLLGFQSLVEEEGRLGEGLRQLATPICFVYEGSREKGQNVVSLLAGGLRIGVTERWCANGGEEWYGSSENMEAVFGFLEKTGVPRMCRVSDCEPGVSIAGAGRGE
jgi:hypothetical protein